MAFSLELDRNYWEVINLLFVLAILFYLNVLETERILQFWNEKFSTCVTRNPSATKNLFLSYRHLFPIFALLGKPEKVEIACIMIIWQVASRKFSVSPLYFYNYFSHETRGSSHNFPYFFHFYILSYKVRKMSFHPWNNPWELFRIAKVVNIIEITNKWLWERFWKFCFSFSLSLSVSFLMYTYLLCRLVIRDTEIAW